MNKKTTYPEKININENAVRNKRYAVYRAHRSEKVITATSSIVFDRYTYKVNRTYTRKIKKTTEEKCNEKHKKETEETLQMRKTQRFAL